MLTLLSAIALLFGSDGGYTNWYYNLNSTAVANNCVSFTVGSGTGCAWMCDYCASELDTNKYYFTNGVCAYEPGGCIGDPVDGAMYTCCSV